MRGFLKLALGGGMLGAAAAKATSAVTPLARSGVRSIAPSAAGAASTAGRSASRLPSGVRPVFQAPRPIPGQANPMKNPTLFGSQKLQEAYSHVPSSIQKGLEGTPLVQAGVPPQVAYQLAHMSKRPGETGLGSTVRHIMGQDLGRRAGAPAVSQTMATKVGTVHWGAFFDEAMKIASAGQGVAAVSRAARVFDKAKAYEGMMPELLPGITAGLGAALAAGYGRSPSAGAALGGSVGAIPFLIRGKGG